MRKMIFALLILSAPVYADDFDDILIKGTRAYVETTPGGEAAGWVRTLMEEMESLQYPDSQITPLYAKSFMVTAQQRLTKKDGNQHRIERIATWAHAIHSYGSSSRVVGSVSPQEFLRRLRKAVDEVSPPPSEPINLNPLENHPFLRAKRTDPWTEMQAKR